MINVERPTISPYVTTTYGVNLMHDGDVVFVSEDLLSELAEADNSWGTGNAFLLPPDVVRALEAAGLATRETKGGYYSTPEQKVALRRLAERCQERRASEGWR